MSPADRIDALRDAIQHIFIYDSAKRGNTTHPAINHPHPPPHVVSELAIPGSFVVPGADVAALLHQLRTDAVAACGYGIAPVVVLRRLKVTQDTLLAWRSIARVDLVQPAERDRKRLTKEERNALEDTALLEFNTLENRNVSEIARKIGVERTTLLGWPRFKKAYKQYTEDRARQKASRPRGQRVGDDFQTGGLHKGRRVGNE